MQRISSHFQYIIIFYFLFYFSCPTFSKTPQSIRAFLEKPALQGSQISFCVKDLKTGNTIYEYESSLKLTPASVMKTITTATALELLGSDFCFETTLFYDGEIADGTLTGNLYIYGSGDPTINSPEFDFPKDSIFAVWYNAMKNSRIQKINGQIIADESIFDTEGVSMKWMREDIGSGYGQGSYGLNIFDNQFSLYLDTDASGTTPSISYSEPDVSFIKFNNYLTARPVKSDSCFIVGFPFSSERYLYGVLPTHKENVKMVGDIPDPALYFAQYFNQYIINRGVQVIGKPTCYRLLPESEKWKNGQRKKIITTYSPPLKELVQIINFVSHNLYADALIKTLGLRYQSTDQEVISSFDKGARIVLEYWNQKGLDISGLWIYDGSGLAITNKLSASFLCDLYIHMATQSTVSNEFNESLPKAGMDGTVRNIFNKTALKGKLRLKSGSMTRVQCYGGYITQDNKKYAVAILINHFSGKNSQVRKAVEELFLSLF